MLVRTITERDLLHSNGRGENPDRELVLDHLTKGAACDVTPKSATA